MAAKEDWLVACSHIAGPETDLPFCVAEYSSKIKELKIFCTNNMTDMYNVSIADRCI